MKRSFLVLLLCCLLFTTACGDGNNSSDADSVPMDDVGETITSRFIDSPVHNLNYLRNSGASGITNIMGEFPCSRGELVTFKIGRLIVGRATCETSEVYPMDLTGESRDNIDAGSAGVKIALILHSLDDDDNPSNGIQINENAKELIDDINIEAATASEFLEYINGLRANLASIVAVPQSSIPDLAALIERLSDIKAHLEESVLIYTPSEDSAGRSAYAYAGDIQNDGKFITAGYIRSEEGGDDNFVISRHDYNGLIDSSFGNNGFVETDFDGRSDRAQSVAIQSDGKIVVAGGAMVNSYGKDFAVARYNSNGTLDTSFGVGGKVSLDINEAIYGSIGSDDIAYAVLVQNDGKILVAGMGDVRYFTLVRYLSNGVLDATFGTNGVVTTNIGNYCVPYALALQSDEKILVGGYAYMGGDTIDDFALVRYETNGSIDETFGASGIVTTDFSNMDYIRSLSVQDDGKIIASGWQYYQMALARYNPDGSLDGSYGTGGKVSLDISVDGEDRIYASKLQDDGKIVVAGWSGMPSNETKYDFALARLNIDGTLDSTFGEDHTGYVTTDILKKEDMGYAMAVQSGEQILTFGTTEVETPFGSISCFAVARYSVDGVLR